MVQLSRGFRKDWNMQEVFCWKLNQLSMNSIHSNFCSDVELSNSIKKTREFVWVIQILCARTVVIFQWYSPFTSKNSCCVGVIK